MKYVYVLTYSSPQGHHHPYPCVIAASTQKDVIIKKGKELIEDQGDEPQEKIFVDIYNDATGEPIDTVELTKETNHLM